MPPITKRITYMTVDEMYATHQQMAGVFCTTEGTVTGIHRLVSDIYSITFATVTRPTLVRGGYVFVLKNT